MLAIDDRVPASQAQSFPELVSEVPSPQRMAQRVVEGLPPPPGAPGGAYSTNPDAAIGSDGSTSGAFQPYGAASSAQQFMVVVNGNSPLLLAQVQQIAPGAGLQSYQGQQVIQAGVFGEEGAATQQAQALSAQGISAQVVAVSGEVAPVAQPAYPDTAQASLDPLPTAPMPAEVPFGQYPALEPQPLQPSSQPAQSSFDYGAPASQNGYFVIIPGSTSSLSAISEQVILLSEGFPIAGRVQERDRPNGPHVMVGPFAGRGAAERWNRYFRDFGLNARVYYQR